MICLYNNWFSITFDKNEIIALTSWSELVGGKIGCQHFLKLKISLFFLFFLFFFNFFFVFFVCFFKFFFHFFYFFYFFFFDFFLIFFFLKKKFLKKKKKKKKRFLCLKSSRSLFWNEKLKWISPKQQAMIAIANKMFSLTLFLQLSP